MDRQTLDMEGARQGEVSAASLQLGDDTIAIRRIATMSIQDHKFKPWDTETNRQIQGVYATSCVAALFFGLVGIAWWLFATGQSSGVIALFIGGVLLLLGIGLGIRAAMLADKLRKTEPYYSLVIGSSDGSKIKLVDDNRPVLEKIRDVIRHKMDTGDTETTGDFDLNLDILNLRPLKNKRPPLVPPPPPADDVPPPAA